MLTAPPGMPTPYWPCANTGLKAGIRAREVAAANHFLKMVDTKIGRILSQSDALQNRTGLCMLNKRSSCSLLRWKIVCTHCCMRSAVARLLATDCNASCDHPPGSNAFPRLRCCSAFVHACRSGCQLGLATGSGGGVVPHGLELLACTPPGGVRLRRQLRRGEYLQSLSLQTLVHFPKNSSRLSFSEHVIFKVEVLLLQLPRGGELLCLSQEFHPQVSVVLAPLKGAAGAH